jgi:hypothetical protein
MPTYLDGMFFGTNGKELNDRGIPWGIDYGLRRDSENNNPRMHPNTTGTL